MKRPAKTSLILVALALFALAVCVVYRVWLVSQPDDSVGVSVSGTSRVPVFAVNVQRPRSDRPFFGILPTMLEAKLLGELRFDYASHGARIGSVTPDHLELSADGWDLLVETDTEGKVTPSTRLVFPIEIAERKYSLRCRPADPANGYLHATTRPGSDVLDGRFLVELAKCENAEIGEDPRHGSRRRSGPGVAVITAHAPREFSGPATRTSLEPKRLVRGSGRMKLAQRFIAGIN